MNPFSSIVVGNESLAIQCGEVLLSRGHTIAALVTRNADVRAWGIAKGLRVEAQDAGLADRLAGTQVDWLFSIANLHLIPDPILTLATKGAVNFHDGPLPRYAGLNAPVWAILNGEKQHGITWHLITAGIDQGDILDQRLFDISPADTALTLNTKCFEAAIDSFPTLVASLESGTPTRRPQDLRLRTLYARADRPAAAGRIDFTQSPAQICALVRALDHGSYFNPLTCAKIFTGDRVLLVGSATPADGQAAPGTVLAATEDALTIACTTGAVRLSGLTCQRGTPVCPKSLALSLLPLVTAPDADVWAKALAAAAPAEATYRRALTALDP
ncbi:MAG: formyltransferase family protein, partial [Paracoccaceae bacterium]